MISYRDIGSCYEVVFRGSNLEQLHYFFNAIKDFNKTHIPIIQNDSIIVGWKIRKSDLDSVLDKFPNAIKIANEFDSIGDTMKLTPYLYQKEAIHYALCKEKALIILPCGSGKSPIGVGLCVEAYKQNLIDGKCLIVVKASLKYQWLKEMEKFSNLRAKIVETPSKAGKKRFKEQFEDCDVFIANYETLKNKDVVERLLSKNIELIYAD